ncbi:hypothetical protein U6G28_01995 [Actinomycetaceae bacterium MB13-C1-2]|nr:hypothetical protein U6G28_01995 [Actinomycetaceae bacterium MB13-C1-2]
MERDSLIPLVIKQSVDHLNSGGVLQMLANWEVASEEETWALRPTRWIEEASEPLVKKGFSVNAWLVQRDLVDVSQYAQWWIKDAKGEQIDHEEWDKEYREWLQDFVKAGTKYVGLGSIAIRIDAGDGQKPDQVGASVGSNRRTSSHTELDHSGGIRNPFVHNISDEQHSDEGESFPATARLDLVAEYLPEGPPADGIAVRTALDNLTVPGNWEDMPLIRAEDVREVRYFIPGSTDPELVRITQGRPGGRDRTVSSPVAALIGVSDGELTPAQVMPAIAMLLDREESTVRNEIEVALPELLRSGVLHTPSK